MYTYIRGHRVSFLDAGLSPSGRMSRANSERFLVLFGWALALGIARFTEKSNGPAFRETGARKNLAFVLALVLALNAAAERAVRC